MNWDRTSKRGSEGWWRTAAAIVCCTSFSLLAGEPIIFPGQKTKIDVDKQSPQEKQDALKLRENNTLPGYSEPSQNPSRSGSRIILNSRAARDRQNKLDEKNNWAFIAPGELQKSDSGDRDLSNVSMDDILKKDNSRDLTFRDVGVTKPVTPGQRPVQARERDTEDNGAKIILDSRDSQSGAHKNSMLDLKSDLGLSTTALGVDQKLLAPEQSALGASANPRLRESLARRDDLGAPLNISRSPGLLSGIGDPINQPSDLTRSPLNPVSGTRSMPAFDGRSIPRDYGRPEVPNSSASWGADPNRRPGGISWFSSLPANTRGVDTKPNLDPPRRKL